ncbi:FKBP-type peptidyl-prolyl cis-trans isomerase [Janibacter limosus]|uniref:FKBP-type peptidyl-prolyl cis-trans isomerase n=1 Tax=Janibacter limosus TaxID=53458 RepID=UPI0035DBF223|nr:FKBP-type peptidyl-prolyl cis-trans isomerase [Janibacter limosus]
MPQKATRLTAAAAASVATMLALSACGGDSGSDPTSDAKSKASASPSASPMTLADPKPADAKQVDSIKIVEGKGKKAPSIKLKDKPLSVSQTTRTVLDKGRGKTLPDDAFVEVDLAMFSGKDGKLIGGSETYSSSPIVLTPGNEGSLPGLVKSLKGQKIGAHGVAVMPPEDLFGEQGAPQYGVDGKDNLVLVYDVRGVLPDKAEGTPVPPKKGMPKVKFHDDAPADISTEGVAKPKKLVTEKLIAGKGKEIKTGDQVYASYTGVRLKDGTMFDTSFKKGGQPFPFVVGQPGTIEARQKAVKGAHVGDRLLLVAPAKDGYGKKGSPDGSIKPNTDRVFVIDILAAN